MCGRGTAALCKNAAVASCDGPGLKQGSSHATTYTMLHLEIARFALVECGDELAYT